LKTAQFVFGQFNGKTQKMYSSPNLESMLRSISISRLMQLGKYAKKYTEYINTLDTERVVAYTFIYPVVEDGRRSTWNHTIVVKFDDVFEELKHIVQKHHVPPKKTLDFLMALDIPLE
jgi:hypothetical protein